MPEDRWRNQPGPRVLDGREGRLMRGQGRYLIVVLCLSGDQKTLPDR